MKPMFGINLSTNKNNMQPNGEEFLVAKPSSAMIQAFEKSAEKAAQTVEKSRFPLWLRITQWICGALGMLFAVTLFRVMLDPESVGLSQAYQNAPYIFWVGGIGLLAWICLKLMGGRRQKEILTSEEGNHAISNLQGSCDAIYAELCVPADAKDVDVLQFFYKEKDGNIKVCEKPMQLTPYFNAIYRVFADSQSLYLCDLEGKYEFPLSQLKGIRCVKKRISIPGWNKDEALNKGEYKQYKLTIDGYGRIHCKSYCILEFACNEEIWGIYIPCYDVHIFEELTGLKAKEE